MKNPSIMQDTHALSSKQESVMEERLNNILSSYKGNQDELIPILQQVQHSLGYLPEQAMKIIAKFLKLPESTIFGVSTFYAQFKLVPAGSNIIRICRGTACHVRGGARVLSEVEKQLGIKPGETTADLAYSLETTACFGACALAPIVVLNDKVHGRMTTQEVQGILDSTSSSSNLND